MNLSLTKPLKRRVLALAIACAIAPAYAQTSYPNKPVTIVVPAAPGGSSDILARMLGTELQKRTGQPFVVRNMPGANGNVGSNFVAKAPADGYTLLSNYSGSAVVNPSLYKNMPYDQGKDLLPVANIVSMSYVVVVKPSLPIKTLGELISMAKDKPGTLAYGTPGYGSGGHLVGTILKLQTGADFVHVPYQGSALALQDLLGGRLDVMFNIVGVMGPHIQAGKLRPLAVLSKQRDPSIPDVPTAPEAGFPELTADAWNGLFAPAGTPKDIVDKINSEVRSIVAQPEIRANLIKSGFFPLNQTPEQFKALVDSELIKYGSVVQRSGMKLE